MASRAKETTPDMLEVARSLWRGRGLPDFEAAASATTIIRLSRILRLTLDAALEPLDVTFSQYEVLSELSFTLSGRLQMRDLCRIVNVHPASMTNTIDRLTARDLVSRESDNSDRRAVYVRLTDSGLELFEKATEVLLELRFGMKDLDAKQLGAMVTSLRELYVAYGFVSVQERLELLNGGKRSGKAAKRAR